MAGVGTGTDGGMGVTARDGSAWPLGAAGTTVAMTGSGSPSVTTGVPVGIATNTAVIASIRATRTAGP